MVLVNLNHGQMGVYSLWLLLSPAEKLQTRNGRENYMNEKTDTMNYLVA
jgi:hypothetical protein